MRWKHDTIIGPDGSPYMRRWVLEARWFTVRLHHILREDYDRTTFHCHPWDFVSVLLRGTYGELRPGDKCPQRRGRIEFRAAEALHRIAQVTPGGAWTLVLTGPKRRVWGFVEQAAWVDWRTWVKAKHGSVKAAYA